MRSDGGEIRGVVQPESKITVSYPIEEEDLPVFEIAPQKENVLKDSNRIIDSLDSFYDLTDFSTMFQDVDGLIPVTAYGQKVALIKDLKGGNDLVQTNTAFRMTITESGFTESEDLRYAYELRTPLDPTIGFTTIIQARR